MAIGQDQRHNLASIGLSTPHIQLHLHQQQQPQPYQQQQQHHRVNHFMHRQHVTALPSIHHDSPLQHASSAISRQLLERESNFNLGLGLSLSSTQHAVASSGTRSVFGPPLVPIKESPFTHHQELRPKLDLSMPQVPGKTRKRHKVATSCNRCRQNKRKCDSGVPCSNCKRNSADCLYTDAQHSRSTWGDSPLSQEKVKGVLVAQSNVSPGTPNSSIDQMPELEIGSSNNTHPESKPTSVTTSRSSGNKPLMSSGSESGKSKSKAAPFNPGTAALEDQGVARRKDMLASQSKQISKAIRVAHPLPHYNTALLFQEKPSSIGTQSNLSHTPKSVLHGNTVVATDFPIQITVSRPQNTVPKSSWASDTGQGHGGHGPMQAQNQGSGNLTYHRSQQQEHQQKQPQPQPQPQQQQQQQHQQKQQQYQQQQQQQQRSDTQGLPGPVLKASSGAFLQQNATFPAYFQDGDKQQNRKNGESGQLPTIHTQIIDYSLPANAAYIPFSPQHDRVDPQQPSTVFPSLPVSEFSNGNSNRQNHVSSIQQRHVDLSQQLQQVDPARSFSQAQGLNYSSVIPAQVPPAAANSDQQSNDNFDPVYSQEPQRFNNNTAIPLRQSTGGQSSPSEPILADKSQQISQLKKKQAESLQMQKIARDMLDIKKYDYCLRLVRHISQEEDELWVAPHSETKNEMQGIPSKLLLLPKDANFLVDVYFENACFYYPIVNRSTVELLMMEPQTPQALFLLNIIFMAACKHLARNTDIKRAVQFRERAREIQHYIDGKTRLSRMQAIILGSQVIYGSFVIVIGMSQDAGTFGDMNNGRENTKAKEVEKEDDEEAELLGGLDLQAESRSIQSKKGTIPEAAYQARLWAFWAFYLRDSMARLYFGWPHGMDTVLVTAELPKIKGCVGMGGKSKSLTGTSEMESVSNIGGSSSGTRKRRESTFNRNLSLPGKRVMKSENRSELTDQGMYRTTLSMVDNDEDTDDDNEDVERSRSSYDSDDQMNHSVLTPDTRPISAEGGEQFHGFYGPGGANNQDQEMTHASVNKRSTLKNAIARGAQERPSLSGLSKTLLEQQSRGKTPSRRHSLGDVQEAKRHMDRMKLLLEAEEDVTDGDSYARILFLEEVKLWSIGRRVALYLANRASSVATTNPQLDNDAICHPFGSAALSSSSSEAGRCSERAWLRDQELQSIQADLIAWDQALPELLRFRSDVDQPDVNHKVNGKMGILTMFYYTITIMLQSSYLPIPQYLFSSQPTSRASSYKSPESLCREFDGVFSRAMSTTSSILDETRIKLEADDFFRSNNNNSNSANNQNHYQQTTGYGTPRSPSKGTTTTNSNKGYFFNTAHQICTQLSNVLYHHVEMLLDSYPNWCTIQAKLNHSLIAAMRVSCLNARLSSNSRAIRDESKAGFKYGSELFKRQAVLPEPLTIRDWPPEEDVQVMMDLEEEFRGLMTSQEEDLAAALSEGLAGLEGGNNYDDEDFFHGAEGEGGGIGGSASGGASRDGVNTGTTGNSSSSGGDGGGSAFYPMYHQNDGQSGFYPPHSNDPAQGLPLNPQLAMVGAASAGTAGYDLFQGHNNGSTSGLGVVVGQPQHIFGLGNDGFKFEYNIDT